MRTCGPRPASRANRSSLSSRPQRRWPIATIDALDLDAPGVVPWWHPDWRDVTLQQILAQMIAETAGHAGHADIVRELVDGSVGLRADDPNVPAQSGEEWAALVDRLRQVASSFDPAT